MFIFSSTTVIPAVLGLTAAAILAVSACFCARRLRRQNKKVNHEAAFPFQAPRPPKAVRSPSGQPPQYLKKNSPSPTSVKLPPGHLSPPEPMQTITTTKYSEEHEVIPKHVINGSNGNESETVEEMSANPEETGKLGTLVFKLRYLTERNALTVSVVRCRGLQKQPVSIINFLRVQIPYNLLRFSLKNLRTQNPDRTGVDGSNGKTQTATDPYVKLQLLPEKQHKVKTR